ncbi:MAG TPA: DUF6644 family protein [Sphingobium sp.]
MYDALLPIMQGLEATSVATAVRESAWLFPVIETLHVMAIVLVVGTIWIVDLRIMGLASATSSIGRILTSTLPATWGSFGVALATGVLMFISSAVIYADNLAFQLKMLLLLFAGTNMLLFHWYTRKGLHQWDSVQTPPSYMRIAGGASFVFWTGVVVAGRWIGF